MLVAQSRPRNLKWYHAGPLLFGDWGTSRLYVLGLAFFFMGHASAMYLAAMSVIMAGVAWCYSIICREFEDGGGVYTSARQLSPILSVIGATMLLCDYIVTASLSALEGFHYLGVPESYAMPMAVVALLFIGLINWFGARSAGRFALFIAIAAVIISLVIALMAIPYFRDGLSSIDTGHAVINSSWRKWQSLVQIMLALSGVEAVSNMTGLMVKPVAKTARKTIWPVLIEVILLNMFFGIALSGLPSLVHSSTPAYYQYVATPGGSEAAIPPEVIEYRDTAVKVLANAASVNALGPSMGMIFGKIAAVIFGLLLLSAANTAIVDKIAVQYAMARDGELPPRLCKLNTSGVPFIPLIFATLAPAAVLIFQNNVLALADLYAVGVVGAIAINVLCCVFNRKLHLKKWERGGMLVCGLVMFGTECTIIVTKPHAAVFAGTLVGIVLAVRAVMKLLARGKDTMPEPESGWLAHLQSDSLAASSASGPRIMLAARGRDQAEFAVELARKRRAALFAIFVRPVRVVQIGISKAPRIQDDPEAQEALGPVAILCRQNGVPFVPIYVSSPDIASEILDYTVTFGCDTLIMGKSQRGAVSRSLAGDVITQVSDALPEGVTLLTRAPGSFQSLLDSVFDRSDKPEKEDVPGPT